MHELTLLYGVVDKVGKVVEENGLDHVDAKRFVPFKIRKNFRFVHGVTPLTSFEKC